MNENKRNRGITLIALIVTIIVLLILAGVAIATLTGDNGILTRANSAATVTDEAKEKEQIKLAYAAVMHDSLVNGSSEVSAVDLQTQLEADGVGSGDEDGEINVTGTGTLTVKMPSGREYTIDQNGNVVAKESVVPVSEGQVASKTQRDNFTDENGDSATIPAGFKVSDRKDADNNYTENEISTGLVVIAPDSSEFVWVPVADINTMANKTSGTDANGRENYQGKLYDFTGTGDETTSSEKTSYGQGTTSFREPDIVSQHDNDTKTYLSDIGLTAEAFQKQMQEDYNAMIESVEKYGGFYVGRYETSINGSTVSSVSNVMPMDVSASSGNMWYGMYKKQRDYTISSSQLSSVSSSMIWGSQYDAMLNWILEGEEKGKVTATVEKHDKTTTGGTPTDVINKIYDLGNNLFEWTLEANDTFGRVGRGGYCYYSEPLCLRYRYSPYSTDYYPGSRLTLYVKYD